MPEHFYLVLEGGDAAYWSILRAMRDAGFEAALDFQPECPLSWRMTIRLPDVYGLNMTALKRILREWLTVAITRGNYTIEEAERLFAILGLE